MHSFAPFWNRSLISIFCLKNVELFAIIYHFLIKIAQHLPDFCQDLPKFAGIQNPDVSGSILDASGIGTSSAGICIWPIHPLLASSCARPAAALRDNEKKNQQKTLFRNAGEEQPRPAGIASAFSPFPHFIFPPFFILVPFFCETLRTKSAL